MSVKELFIHIVMERFPKELNLGTVPYLQILPFSTMNKA